MDKPYGTIEAKAALQKPGATITWYPDEPARLSNGGSVNLGIFLILRTREVVIPAAEQPDDIRERGGVVYVLNQ